MQPIGACLALCLLVLASARPLFLLDEAPQQGWESKGNEEVPDVGQGLSSLLNWVNGQLDSVENLLDNINAQSGAEESTDSSPLQRQNAFRIQDGSPLDGFLQDVMQQLDGRDARSSSVEGSDKQFSETTTEVTQTPEGTLTRVYITSPGDGSGPGQMYEQFSGPRPGQVQTAFDVHLEERMRQLEQMSAQGSISASEADRLRRLFSSQEYMEAWARQQQQAEWQRNMALGQTLLQQQQQWLQSVLLPAQQGQQQEQQQQEGAFQGMTAEGGPLQDLLDLMLAPFQEEASGCRHRRQQQQQQHMMMMTQQQQQQDEDKDTQVSNAGPRLWVRFVQGDAGSDPSPRHVHRPPPSAWRLHWIEALLALLAAAIISYKLVREVQQLLQLRRQRNELRAHLLSHEAARKVCGGGFNGGVAGAKCLDSGKAAFLPPKAAGQGKPEQQQQQQQQQQEQQGFVSNVVYAADHL
uniref:Uncharacterized protein n=1 Tax=Dunaliella tertiolecta TaxID=3047 RepID=A0A7S3VS99_DUNTE